MATEGEPPGIPLSRIHLDLQERSLTLEADQQLVAKLTWAAGTIYFQAGVGEPIAGLITSREAAPPSVPEESADAPEVGPEKARPVILTGKLKSQPQAGRPDRQGHATVFARFAAHEPDREEAHLYLATFHRGSARLALGLPVEAQVTVEGYPHLNPDPAAKRLDTLSVFRLLHYPGKPEPSPTT